MRRFLAGLAALTLVLGSAQLEAQPAPPQPAAEPPKPAEPPPQGASPEPAPSPPTEPTAAEPAPQAKPKEILEPEEAEAPLVVPARDTLGGHFVIGASAAFVAPFAELDSETASNELIGVGPGFGLDLGYGLSRQLALGVSGDLLLYSSTESCSDCSATSLAGRLFVRYHVVQGVRYDPWISAGIGFRTTNVDPGPGDSLNYSGLEWLQLRFGGDWYPLSVFGFGPFVEVDLGTYFTHDGAPDASASVYVNFQAGGRFVLDFPGK